MKFLSFLYTKWMETCEAMTSSTHSFAYSYGLVKKCFLQICETSKFHNFLIFQPIFIRFSLFCSENFTLSSEMKLDQLRTSPLTWLPNIDNGSGKNLIIEGKKIKGSITHFHAPQILELSSVYMPADIRRIPVKF